MSNEARKAFRSRVGASPRVETEQERARIVSSANARSSIHPMSDDEKERFYGLEVKTNPQLEKFKRKLERKRRK